MTRSFTTAPPAVAATLLFAACVNLTPEWAGRNGAGGQGGRASSDTATGGSAGAGTFGSGGAGGGSGGGTSGMTAGGAGGLPAAGGVTAVGGAAGRLDAGSVADATRPADGGIDVPYPADVSLPDRGTGGTGSLGGSGGTDAGAAGSGGTGAQAGSAGGGQTGTGGTAGGSAGTDAGVAGSGGTAGSGGGGSGGASSSGSGGAGATGGSGGSTATTPTGGATPTCTPVPKSSGGIACPGGFCTVGTYSGYDFSFADPTGKSSVCAPASSLCGAGTVGAQNPPSYTVWGAGFGFNLSPQTVGTAIVPVQLSGTGVTVTLTSLPTGADMRVQVAVGGVAYCALMSAATQILPWTAFNTKCWAPSTGIALTGAPKTPNIQFQASSRTTAGSFDFCVTALSFQ